MSVNGASAVRLAADAFLEEEAELSERLSNLAEQAQAEEPDGEVPPPPDPHTTPTKPKRPRPDAETPTEPSVSPAGTGGLTPTSAASPSKLCLACPLPACKGSLCSKHKRVSDNVYNEEKKKKASDPERWKRFMQIRKAQGDEWVRILVEAEATKGGNPGSGRATATFNAMQSVQSVAQTSSMDAQFRAKSMNCRMYMDKIMKEWGWDVKDAGEEWKRVLASTPKHKIHERPTAPGRKMEPWIYVHDVDELIGSQGISHSNRIDLSEKPKKNPTEADITAAEETLASSSVHFSDQLFAKMSATSAALQSVRDSGSALVDSSGRSFIFADEANFRQKASTNSKAQGESEKKEKKAKGKAFNLEDVLDGLELRLTKKFQAGKKLCEDLIKDIDDAIQKESDENKTKMNRILLQLQSRLLVIKGLASTFDGEVPEALTFKSVTPPLNDIAVAALEQEVTDVHRQQFAAALKFNELVSQAYDAHKAATAITASEPADTEAEEEQSQAVALAEEKMQAVTDHVAELHSRDFAVEEGSPEKLFDHVTLRDMLCSHGWAGSGFSGDVAMMPLLADARSLVRIVFGRIFFNCVVAHFLSTAKPMMDAKLMHQLLPVELIAFQRSVQCRLLIDEEGVKAAETSFKDDMDLVKNVVTIVKSSLTTFQKQSRELRRESARLQSQQDKERLAAEKQREKEEKSKLRSIQDQMKGCDKLPGLLAYCGTWVKPVKEYKTLEEYKSQQSGHDYSTPFVISDVATLKAEDAGSAARVNFSLFKAGRAGY